MYYPCGLISPFFGLVSVLLIASVRAEIGVGNVNPAVVYPSSLTWGGLCIVGLKQSPVNILTPATVTDSTLRRLQTSWAKESHGKLKIDNHVIKFIMSETGFNASTLIIDDQPMFLDNFHFHSFSIHSIDGKFYPLEVHFVHYNRARTREAVVTVFFHLSANDNPFLTGLLNRATTLSTNAQCAPVGGNCLMDMDGVEMDPYDPGLGGVVKLDASYFRYGGSLSSPPCTEFTTWIIMKDSVGMSATQLARYQLVLFSAQGGLGESNRLPQPLNGRSIRVYNAPGGPAVGDLCDCPQCDCNTWNHAGGTAALPLWATLALLLSALAASYKLLL